MGLMTQMQDDAERLVRQEKNLNRGYQHGARQLKAEAAPHEQVVKDYNTQVEGFKQSAIRRESDGELWQIVGHLSGTSTPAISQPVNYPGGYVVPGAPNASEVWGAGNLYAGSGVNNQGMYGYYKWQNSPQATLRTFDGTPVRTWQNSADNVTPVQAYASWNDRPFVAPVTKDQEAAATSADAVLSSIGERGEAMKTEHSKAAGLIGARADRLALDSEMMQNQAREATSPQASVFDQNLTVFQSIVDWLK